MYENMQQNISYFFLDALRCSISSTTSGARELSGRGRSESIFESTYDGYERNAIIINP